MFIISYDDELNKLKLQPETSVEKDSSAPFISTYIFLFMLAFNLGTLTGSLSVASPDTTVQALIWVVLAGIDYVYLKTSDD